MIFLLQSAQATKALSFQFRGSAWHIDHGSHERPTFSGHLRGSVVKSLGVLALLSAMAKGIV